ncbi:hypothetical protein AAFC00_001146 [Neodothiora populina]|uniref:Elongin-A n=1 Tax=Neodothiora populina TaxID=2781224 RepID=A0ABR3PMX1_9PEZI
MVPSLIEMCQRAAIRDAIDIRDVGELPYRLVRPMLRKITNPGQLAEIEEASPHIAEDSGEIWRTFIKRDIPDGDRKMQANAPANPADWGKVYRKLKRADQRQQDAAEEQLKAALSGKKSEKAKNAVNIIHSVIPQGKKNVWGGAPRDAPSGTQALRNARTAADQLKILKSQTATRQQGRNAALSIASHELQQRRGVVQQAPRSMVSQYNRNQPKIQQPPVPTQTAPRPTVFAPRTNTRSASERAINMATIKEQEAKEKRLRALTASSSSRPSTTVARKSASPPARPASHPSSSLPSQSASRMPRKRPAYDPFLPAKKRKV